MLTRAEGCMTKLHTTKPTFFFSGGKLGIQGLLKMGVFTYTSRSSGNSPLCGEYRVREKSPFDVALV